MTEQKRDDDFVMNPIVVDKEARGRANNFISRFVAGFERVGSGRGFDIVDRGAEQGDHVSCLLAVMVETARSKGATEETFSGGVARILGEAKSRGIVDEDFGIAQTFRDDISELADSVGLAAEFVDLYPNRLTDEEITRVGERAGKALNEAAGIALLLNTRRHYVLLHKNRSGRIMAYDFLEGQEQERTVQSIAGNLGNVVNGEMKGDLTRHAGCVIFRSKDDEDFKMSEVRKDDDDGMTILRIR